MLNERGALRRPFPPSPLSPRGAAGQGGAHGERLHASREPARRSDGHTHMGGGGVQTRPHPPPPSQGLADIFGEISRRMTAARAGTSAAGEGIDPHPRGRGLGGGGGQEHGTSVNPHPSGGGTQGAKAAISAAQVQLDPPPPGGAMPGQQGWFLPPSPT